MIYVLIPLGWIVIFLMKCIDEIIRMSSVTHLYSDKNGGIRDINLNIFRGEFILLAGANGSGKTTLLRHLNGLLFPQSGSIYVKGISVAQDPVRARCVVGMVFQDADSQIVGETVYADAAFGPENLGWSSEVIQTSVNEVLEWVGLSDLRFQSPYLLSGGEKRRLAIAGVLVMRPEVIVLDEPFANLDFQGTRQVLGKIVALHQSGHTVVVSAHEIEKVIAHVTRLIIIHQGRIVQDGAPLKSLEGIEAYGIRKPCAIKMGGLPESWLS
jgi:biotin transport system ATP-binding protein